MINNEFETNDYLEPSEVYIDISSDLVINPSEPYCVYFTKARAIELAKWILEYYEE